MLYPSLPILLASGFTDINGVIGTDLPRLGKPYGLKDLSAALEALGLSSGRTPR
jgi:hypothetical protein